MSNQEYIEFTFKQARKLGKATAIISSLVSLLEDRVVVESYKLHVIEKAKNLLKEIES